jgi:hypothetical protein
MSLAVCANQSKLAVQPSSNDQRVKKMDIKALFLANKRHFYTLYLLIDSSKLSFSIIKYSFDIYFANTDLATKAMKEWINTPEGFATSYLSASAFIMISLLANKYDKEDKNQLKRYTAIAWPYVRDSIKGLRNVHRGMQSTLTLIHLLDIEDLRQLIVPASIALGVVTIANRIWFRAASKERSNLMTANARLLAEIKAAKALNSTQINELYKKIQKHSKELNIQLLVSAVLAGMIDGLNPFIGTLSVGLLSPSMLIVITVFCALYFLATLMIKIYEEINLQNQFIAQEKEIKLALLEKEMVPVYPQPVVQSTPALISGVKNGLTGYKYIMLTISTILFISPIKINSIEPINRAILGLTVLLAGLAHAYMPSFKSDRKAEVGLPAGEKESSLTLLSQRISEGKSVSGKKESAIEMSAFETSKSEASIYRNSFFGTADKVKECSQSSSELSSCR